jgi:hypothetical protein
VPLIFFIPQILDDGGDLNVLLNAGMILTRGTEVLGGKHYTAWVVGELMSMEQWWNDTDRGKLKYWEENIIERGW